MADRVRDGLNGERADDVSAGIDDRSVHRLAGEQVRQGVAQDVVELDDRIGGRAQLGTDALPCQPALAQPAERPLVGVDEQRDVQIGVGDARPHLGRLLAGAACRDRPQIDVAHPLQGEALERAVGADEVLDECVGRRRQQLGRRRVLLELAADLHDRDAVAHLDRLVDVVGDEDDRLTQLGLQAQELVLQPLAADRVDRAERLVHQHDRRIDGERTGDPDALALAAGQLGGEAVAHLWVEPDQVQQLVDARIDARLVPADELRDGRDVLADRPVREQADLLDDVADVAAQLLGLAVAHAAAAEQDVAGGDVDHAVDHPHRRRLAAPGWTHENADLTRGDLERQTVDRGLAAARVPLRHVSELQGLARRASGSGLHGAILPARPENHAHRAGEAVPVIS